MKKSVIRVILWLVLASLSAQLCWAAEGTSQAVYDEVYRPQFHYTCKKGWLSDIDGVFYYDGEYHMCYQHVPDRPVCDYGQTHWGHAVSKDLLHWEEQEPIIAPDERGPAFSGTAVVDWNNDSGLQTGSEKVLLAFYTAAGYIINKPRGGMQCLAYSNDRGRTWTKYEKNPVLRHIARLNRDPKVFWYEPTKQWIMVITIGGPLGEPDFAIFFSENLKEWDLYSTYQLEGCCDCPDMFELPVDGDKNNMRWVVWGGAEFYGVGQFDGKIFKRQGPVLSAKQGMIGYAAQTFSDIPASDGRRIQVSWLFDHFAGFPSMPFSQQASFPLELTLRTVGEEIRLCREPIKEIEQLHRKRHTWKKTTLKPGKNLLAGITGDAFDVRAEIEPGGDGQVVFNVRGTEIVYDAKEQRLSCLGKSAVLEPVGSKIKLQVLIDRSSIEIFGNDGLVTMFYIVSPDPANKTLGLSTSQGEVKIVSMDVYEMASIWRQ